MSGVTCGESHASACQCVICRVASCRAWPLCCMLRASRVVLVKVSYGVMRLVCLANVTCRVSVRVTTCRLCAVSCRIATH